MKKYKLRKISVFFWNYLINIKIMDKFLIKKYKTNRLEHKIKQKNNLSKLKKLFSVFKNITLGTDYYLYKFYYDTM